MGSNPSAATSEANFSQHRTDSFQKSQVLPEATELLQLRELLYILLGNKGRRHLELRQKPNIELFTLYEGELAFRHRSAKGIHEAKRILKHFHNYLGEYPPTPELAKSFLSTFSHRKPTTLARYVAELKIFLKWYGEDLDINIKVPKTLPSYVEKTDIEKLLEAVRAKKNHKNTIDRDILLIDLAIHTGLRRSELASLRVGDIDIERQVLVVRQGKGSKDRIIPLSKKSIDKLSEYIKSEDKDSSLFGLAPASISGKIKSFATKAGVGIHTHSLRDYFATSLSEKGATIREIQALLGHANLTHTERYTLHTDKHLKHAIELIDKEPEKKALSASEKIVDKSRQPIVIFKTVCKPSWKDSRILSSDYHSHFIVYNDGDRPAIEIELALLDNNKILLEGYRETALRVREEFKYEPILNEKPEGKYYLICQYKNIDSKELNQTWLPFELGKASKVGEVYVTPGELRIEFNASKEQLIQIFTNKPI